MINCPLLFFKTYIFYYLKFSCLIRLISFLLWIPFCWWFVSVLILCSQDVFKLISTSFAYTCPWNDSWVNKKPTAIKNDWFFSYFVKASVNCGTTCFLRDTTPFNKALLFSNFTPKASSTAMIGFPNANTIESLSRMFVTTRMNKS